MKKKSKCIHKECINYNYFDIKWYKSTPLTWCAECGKKHHNYLLEFKGQLFFKKDYPELCEAIKNLK